MNTEKWNPSIKLIFCINCICGIGSILLASYMLYTFWGYYILWSQMVSLIFYMAVGLYCLFLLFFLFKRKRIGWYMELVLGYLYLASGVLNWNFQFILGVAILIAMLRQPVMSHFHMEIKKISIKKVYLYIIIIAVVVTAGGLVTPLIFAMQNQDPINQSQGQIKYMIEPLYEQAFDFKDGYAAVIINDENKIIDKDGKYEYFSDDPYQILLGEGRRASFDEIEGKYSLTDHEKNLITDAIFIDIQEFSDGLATALMEDPDTGEECYVLVDTNGKIRFQLEEGYEFCGKYSEGLIRAEKDGEYGFIVPSSEVSVPFIYTQMENMAVLI